MGRLYTPKPPSPPLSCDCLKPTAPIYTYLRLSTPIYNHLRQSQAFRTWENIFLI